MARLRHSMWLFHLHSTVKRRPFSPVFPLAESMPGAFLVIPLAFQGIKHQPFSMTQPFAKVSSRPLPNTAGTEDFNVFSRWLNPSCLNSSSLFSPHTKKDGWHAIRPFVFSLRFRETTASETNRRASSPSVDPYERLGRGKGEVWRGEGGPFSRKVPLPPSNLFISPRLPQSTASAASPSPCGWRRGLRRCRPQNG